MEDEDEFLQGFHDLVIQEQHNAFSPFHRVSVFIFSIIINYLFNYLLF
jgi:hypothetical protein